MPLISKIFGGLAVPDTTDLAAGRIIQRGEFAAELQAYKMPA